MVMYESFINCVEVIRGEEKIAVNPVSFKDFIVMFIESMFVVVEIVDMACSIVVILVNI